MLGLLSVQDYAQGFGLQKDSLDAGYEAARRAVDLAPTSPLAHFALAQALFFRKDLEKFRHEAERTVSLNPMDGSSLALVGEMLAHSGEWERGLALTRRARELNPHHPGWYWYVDFYDAYRRRDYRSARDVALKFGATSHWGAHLLMAAACAQLGDREAAAQAVREAIRLRPSVADTFAGDAEKWFEPGFAAHLTDGLRKAGLEVAAEGSAGAPALERPPSSPPLPGSARADEGFWVAVLPFKHGGDDADLKALAEGLTEEIITGLSRFSYLRVISRGTTSRYSSEAADVRSVGKDLGARYVMEGSLRQAAGKLRLGVQLVDTASGAHLWAENYERPFRREAIFELQDELVPRIVSTVADIHGVLPRSMTEAVRSRPPDQLTPYEAVLRSFCYFLRVNSEESDAARSALERAVRKAPEYADAWAMLALVSAQEYGQGYKLVADSLAEGAIAARRAVEVGPTNHLAFSGLAQVLFLQKDFQAFRNAAERAVALNPMDGATVALTGILLAYSGDWEHGCAVAEKAMRLNPHFPGWYRLAEISNAYRKRDYRAALDAALKIQMPDYFWTPVYCAAAYGQLGEPEPARKALEELLAVRPEFGSQVRDELGKWYDPELVEHFIDGLRKAGLGVPAAETVSVSTQEARGGARPLRKPRPGLLVGGGVAVILLGAAFYMATRSRGARSAPQGTQTAAAPAAIRSLAVLPLDNYSGDPNQDYFAEGMTDELTSDLANISHLRVISRGSVMQFKGKNRPPTPEIAKKLDVDAVIEGSVNRSGDKVRITAQLIDARSDEHLWSKSFERSSKDVLALQDELASAIANEIHVQLTPAEQSRLASAPRVDPEAHDAYLKGRYFFNRPSDENLMKAIQQFEDASKRDPSYAPAFSGLSDAYLWAAFNEGVITASEAGPRSKTAAEKAVQLDASSAEAHTSLAVYKVWYEYDWAGSESEFRKAFALNPNYAFAHDQFGLGLAFQGRLDEAVAEGKRAAELDPLSPQIPIDNLMALAWQDKYEEAKEEARRSATLDPTFFFAPFMEGWIDIQAGRVRDAVPALQKAKALEAPPFVTAWLGYAYGASGDRVRALATIEELKKRSLNGFVPPYNLALVSLGLGDRERALDDLEKALASSSQWMIYLRGDRIFDPLRSEPRFKALLKKLNFEK
jgi:TolB-like protein/Tfp pilus assembly protein PilF